MLDAVSPDPERWRNESERATPIGGGGTFGLRRSSYAVWLHSWHMWHSGYAALPERSGPVSCGTSGRRDSTSSSSVRALNRSPLAAYSRPSS